ncbi:hypothetical protein HZU40_09650 [Mycolicibacterium fluoranthenivorans]|uniref:Uncharacterized protein n=1 Tax=Mycolicibacterium fluoranthenivorans TaxID=258505 RepID=A0A7G8PB13_9MYCO|nr:hypothetical protein [Mycolicibacterium fluoranthenivorans]QNJ91529.1 hypothetical protein HZU40_25570 [Mycolicibacterium fluoranthenivorans]QNJ94497.1 hypothetical protein HZU40_09650 [Mycolicibacterium fluoranthenivorans]
MPTDDATYAQLWADEINNTYTEPYFTVVTAFDLTGDQEPDVDAAIQEALIKAAKCLRFGVPATFTHGELEAVRHLMPAHEVHQSMAARWMTERYGSQPWVHELWNGES